jgi:hypothetical protein
VVDVDLFFLTPDGEGFGLFVLPLGRPPLLFGKDAGVEVEGRGGLNLGGIFVLFCFASLVWFRELEGFVFAVCCCAFGRLDSSVC